MIEKLKVLHDLVYGTQPTPSRADRKIDELINKQNEIIDALNSLLSPTIGIEANQEEKQKTLWVNENGEVVEFCCAELKSKMALHEITWYMHKERGKIYMIRPQGFYDTGLECCPYCSAPIALKEDAEKERILWVNDCEEVVEFCCNSMKEAFSNYYTILLCDDFKGGLIPRLRKTDNWPRPHELPILVNDEECPYCHAHITLKEEVKKDKQVRITLLEKDASVLRSWLFQIEHREQMDALTYARIWNAISHSKEVKERAKRKQEEL